MVLNIHRIHLDTVDSTNNYVRRLLDEGDQLPDITLVESEDQTAGRGQQGNSWETELGKNLIFSLVCHPTWVRPAQQYVFSESIALAVARALRQALPPDEADKVKVKWPNDIYYCDKKISGTLIECDLFGRSISNCIVGTGININQQLFRSNAPNPVSLHHILQRDTDRETVLLSVLKEFVTLYLQIKEGGTEAIHALYKTYLYRNDNQYYAYSDDSGPFTARIIDIEPSGRMILQTPSGETRRYEFKEVKFIL